jgi:hypothetical protein
VGLEGIRVVHAIPGRIRLKVAGMRGNPRMADEVEERLVGMQGVRTVEASPVTGSVLVVFDTEEVEATDFGGLLSQALPALFPGLDVADVSAGINGGGNGTGHQPFDRQIVAFFGSLNAGVGRATQGIDLKLLVPSLLVLLGVRGLLFSDKVPFPNWYDFFWFGLSTFVMFNLSAGDAPAGPAPAVA